MDSSSTLIIPLDGAQLVLFMGGEDTYGSVENVDAVLEMSDGSRWSATILSLAELTAVMNRWQESGENLAGRYFVCPDLVVLRHGGVAEITEVFHEILRTGGPDGILKNVE